MAQAGSAYNLHERHKKNHVKIGNWVEERALIESAPGMCIPEWSDRDPETGAKVRWSNKMTKPDSHETRLLTGSFLEKEEYSTCTKDDFAPVAVHKEPTVGVRDAAIIQALMEEAKNPPPEPEPKMQFDREYDAYARESKPRPEITESYAEMPPITVYTHNGKNSIAPDGNFGVNADFSTPAERYTKGPYKTD